MDDLSYDQEYDNEYDDYRDPGLTSVGLPPGQLALIIGVNAVISLVISIAVVLIANRQVLPGDLAASATGTPESAAEAMPPETEASPEPGDSAGGDFAGEHAGAIRHLRG